MFGGYFAGLRQPASSGYQTFPMTAYKTPEGCVHSRSGDYLPLSKTFEGAFSGGEIHCLLRLRREGFPERLSRSQQLVHQSAALVLCEEGSPRSGVPHMNAKRAVPRCPFTFIKYFTSSQYIFGYQVQSLQRLRYPVR